MDRRTLLKNMALIAGTGARASLLGLAQGRGERGAAESTGTSVILLGTGGGPGVSLTRSQTASVVMAGGKPYLVDSGYGTVRALTQAGIRLADISNIFVSHLHNDHTADI